jgi:hypothetical protein
MVEVHEHRRRLQDLEVPQQAHGPFLKISFDRFDIFLQLANVGDQRKVQFLRGARDALKGVDREIRFTADAQGKFLPVGGNVACLVDLIPALQRHDALDVRAFHRLQQRGQPAAVDHGRKLADTGGPVPQMAEVRHQVEHAEVIGIGGIHEPREPFLDAYILSPEREVAPHGESSEQQAFRLKMGIDEARDHQLLRRVDHLRARVE